ncbi:MAG: c-type cytochrome, partial [Proteobacteria bacterium]|nr:c-type cytochrome [Pseudomonadota bacterium]
MKKLVTLMLILSAPVCFAQTKWKAPSNYIPNVSNGEKLYQSNCSVCHGAKGMGETATGKAMKKKPAIIGDPKVLNRLSPEKVYALVTKGVTDQGMPSYSHLTEKE